MDAGDVHKSVKVFNTALVDSQQGIELGFSTPSLMIEAKNLLIVDNYIGLRLADNYGWEVRGSLRLRNSVFYRNHHDILNLHRDLCTTLDSHFFGLSNTFLQTPSEGNSQSQHHHTVFYHVVLFTLFGHNFI